MRVVPIQAAHGWDGVVACVGAQKKGISNKGKLAKRNAFCTTHQCPQMGYPASSAQHF